jgi:hypothetical protein
MLLAEPNTEPLWTRARAMYARAVAAIGDAASIAMLQMLPRSLRRRIIAWLCPLEHVVRKLLLVEACEIHGAERALAAGAIRIERIPLRGMAQSWTAGLQTRMCSDITKRCASEDARSKRDLACPETWRARFSFALPRDPHVVPDSRAPRIRALWGPTSPPPPEPPPRTPRISRSEDAPFRLARRFEALRRVLENPRAYAERLAHVLAREVRRFGQIARRCAIAPCRSNDYDPDDPRLGIDAMGAGFVRSETAFSDSS